MLTANPCNSTYRLQKRDCQPVGSNQAAEHKAALATARGGTTIVALVLFSALVTIGLGLLLASEALSRLVGYFL